MKISLEKITSRNYLLKINININMNINDNFYIHVIKTEQEVIISDSFLGPDAMKAVTDFIVERFKINLTAITVFNSHAHHDHYWGNCYFESNKIISSNYTAEEIDRNFLFFKKIFSKQSLGKVLLKKPNTTFDKKLDLKNDKICFFYSPGHTLDSSSIYDYYDNVLYVGDNIDKDGPLIDTCDIKLYINTLEYYLKLDPDYIISAHAGLVDRDIIQKHLIYLKKFEKKLFDLHALLPEEDIINYKIFYFNFFQKKLEEKMKCNFSLDEYLEFTFSIFNMEVLEIINTIEKKYNVKLI